MDDTIERKKIKKQDKILSLHTQDKLLVALIKMYDRIFLMILFKLA